MDIRRGVVGTLTSYGYDDFHKLIGITVADLSAIITEKFIEVAIGLLNLFGAGLSDLTGTAGSKIINCSNTEWAAIVHVTRIAYIDFYEDVGGDIEVQDLSAEVRNFLTDPKVLEGIKIIAHQLQSQTSSAYDDIILV